ncbi:M14 family metallopeptidase [Bowmanella sp. JS7-9]|uniref:M14 family metallopeptidase n=1 Tax=Pseudobowmanella zhangzhouensis TaxID=1537679 RepID=A0ABW1XRL3_9ALTE|nr:M14 family metallopeptidase [Bowmanella sp. JS7-9]TBX23776.1 hypothetical protein TK45_06730 [Bowmanella sp. JS7-9]
MIRRAGLMAGLLLASQWSWATECESGKVHITDDFAGGNIASCAVKSEYDFVVGVAPENTPINPSPWYAMALSVAEPGKVTISLEYQFGKHRYIPKVSKIGDVKPVYLQAEQVVVNEDGSQAVIHLSLEQGEYTLSAQPLVTNEVYQSWRNQLQQSNPGLIPHVVAHSVENRPIRLLESRATEGKQVVLLLGRAHPPEVTGAFAMQSFLLRLNGATALAKRFRERFSLLMLPNLNPDGVEHGYWRHNMNGVDLNRDWGPFTQPETRGSHAFIHNYLKDKQLVAMLDFHSTQRNVLYVQKQDQPSLLPEFAEQWLQAMQHANIPLDLVLAPGHNPTSPTSKTWFYSQYQVPAITYEMADTAAEGLHETAEIAADTFMQQLLSRLDKS